jgi:hypothetical protein
MADAASVTTQLASVTDEDELTCELIVGDVMIGRVVVRAAGFELVLWPSAEVIVDAASMSAAIDRCRAALTPRTADPVRATGLGADGRVESG